ncbi:SRPBCC family protein [Urbifossiella limnaea]|uniref:Polyketide cyclase / dehydrase and lipid transport n=1 Tax=Urbifossiella limnaea TaxID=2528023 RepID=A0A517Y055_9BACT|nr:SRPBCC family protein [Urbifossiella limnaea]QDU23146.1 Polyketide cyclase / dehydrase and lipid transport [Urbifossiella limnaea]
MPGFDLTHTVAAPLPVVFDAFTDFASAPKRIPEILRVEMLTPGPVGVGTAFKETRKMFGKECTETMTVSAFEAGKLVELSATSCGAVFTTRFTFEPDGGKTRVSVAFRTKAVSVYAKLFTPLSYLMMGTMKKCVAGDVAKLGAAVEAAPAA